MVDTIKTWQKREPKLSAENQYRFLDAMLGIAGDPKNLKLAASSWREVHDSLVDLRTSDSEEHRKVATRFFQDYLEGKLKCSLDFERRV